MKYSFRFSNLAEKDMDEIYRYIAVELSNRPAASRLYKRFEQAIDRLRNYPESGQLIDNYFTLEYRLRKVIIGNYILIYYPNKANSCIEILRIAYAKRDQNNIFYGIDKLMENL